MAQTTRTDDTKTDDKPAAEPKKPTLEQRVTWLEEHLVSLIGEAPTTVPEQPQS